MAWRLTAGVLLTLLSCSTGAAGSQEPSRAPIHIAAIVEASLTDVRDGIEQGLQEMQRTASLLGRELQITWVAGPLVRPVEQLAADKRFPPVHAVVTAGQPDTLAAATNPGVPVLDVSPAAPTSFGDAADRWIFLVRAERPGTEWNPGLARFGAGELNERYRRRTGKGMTADAWAGWVAVKAIVEAALRADAADPATLADALRHMQFDAHKGEPLYFDEAQRLVQPTY